jgi:hypothetical protein
VCERECNLVVEVVLEGGQVEDALDALHSIQHVLEQQVHEDDHLSLLRAEFKVPRHHTESAIEHVSDTLATH